MTQAPLNVLFLCTGNSARSILAEALLNREGAGRFRAFSAGSQPAGRPHPLALALLQREGYDTRTARSKSWEEFAAPGAPVMDFVFTVCDSAAQTCPIWPGHPASAHWGLPDPAAAQGSEAERALAFADTYRRLRARILTFVALPMAQLAPLALTAELQRIGQS